MLENNKISIIVDLRDDNDDVFLQNLAELDIPAGYTCDVIIVRGATSKVAAYMEGYRENNAKYKLYLDGNTIIRKKDLLCQYMEIFNNNSQIAVLDVSGNTVIPTNGICIKGRCRVGGYMMFNEGNFTAVDEPYVEVAAVDGFVFATQYDISWQENSFVNDRLALTAQCVEYTKAGYKIAVVGQSDEYIALKNDSFTIDEEERNKFLDQYSAVIYPKVLVGIITYNRPEYLQVALRSAMEQTYRNIEIVVSDDSTNNETSHVMQKYLARDKRISYYKHDNYSAIDNVVWMMRYFKQSDVEYINFLMDDDLIYPTKIEKMMTYYLEFENISLVTSYRHLIDANGEICPNTEYTKKVFENDTLVPGEVAGREMLAKGWNFVGEFSTTLLCKSLLREDVLFGWIDNVDFTLGLIDMSTWLQLATKGNLLYIAEPLSAFRVHGAQAQGQNDIATYFMLHWGRMIKFAIDNNVFLTTEALKRQALVNWYYTFSEYLYKKVDQINMDEFIYENAGDLLKSLGVSHVNKQGLTGEQLIGEDLPLKRHSK